MYLMYNYNFGELIKLNRPMLKEKAVVRQSLINSLVEVVEYNFKNIEAGIEALYDELTRLKNMNESEKMELFKSIQAKRLEMYDENGKNTL